MVIYANSPEEALQKFEEEVEEDADKVSVQLIRNDDPRQLLFPFIQDAV